MQDKEIIELIRKRDPKGAEALLQHYGPLMRYIIQPILSNPEDREECLSEVAMRVWDKIELFDAARGSWNAWLTSLTRNAGLNRCRQNSRHDAGSDDISENVPSGEPTPEEALVHKEYKQAVYKVLGQLPDKEKALFYRKYYYLQSTAQIASELGMTERAVEGKLYRLKKTLRKLLGGEINE